MKRVLRWVLAGLGGLLLAASVAVGGLLWWSLPGARMTLQVEGLGAPVRVGFDADGVPRIEAGSEQDGALALGFVHARDRMFQMELMRRAASGRLSEIAGGATLRLDRTMRTLGLRRRAEADLLALDAGTRGVLEAYAVGVNAWIGERGRFAAPEFIALGAPEPWSAVDCLLWGKTMGLYLSSNWRQEVSRAGLLAKLGEERVRALWPEQGGSLPPDARLGAALTRMAGAVPAFPDAFTLPPVASNEWALDGARSATGAPLLAGDPHLALSMPSIWYLARIVTPSGVLVGATAPGVPFLVMGHNGRIAWTFTTTGADTQDVFVETAVGDGYASPTGPLPFQRFEERIRVRGGADEVLVVRETRHGPVLSDLDGRGDDPAWPVLAVAMANLAPGDAAPGLLALNRAGTVGEAGVASEAIVAPVQNLLVADRVTIGLFTTGRVPIRRSGDGALPVAGADGAHDWTGFAAGAALPRVLDPASGRIVNANERTVGASFPVFMGRDWFGDWRAARVRAMLDTRTTHTVASLAQMQVDSVSTFAQALLPRLLKTRPADAASRSALLALGRWDAAMRIDRAQPALFNDWMQRFEDAVLEASGVPAGVAGMQADLVARALGPDGSAGCGGDCDALLTRTLTAAAAAWDPEAMWGDLHKAEFAHPLLGRLPGVGWLFTWSTPQPGDDTTVFRGGMRRGERASVHGPGFRGVYDLADLDRSVFAIAPGQSGHPLRDAGRLMRRWKDGTSMRLGPVGAAVETVELRP